MGDRQNTCDMKDGEGTEASRVKVVGRRTVQQDIYENGTIKFVTFDDDNKKLIGHMKYTQVL